ncbi:MAG: RNA methyltransferase [Chloroflexia bacterium]|nr:RNA methyltransferase [Chloroflexia bacterium]
MTWVRTFEPEAGSGPIEGLRNPLIRRVRSLLRRKARYEERAFLVEGARAVGDMTAAGITALVTLVRDSEDDLALIDLAGSSPVRLVAPRLFDELTDLPHPQGILSVVSMDDLPDGSVDTDDGPELLLIADGMRDPGNLGTLFRSAAGAGVSAIWLTPDTVDPFNPKCVRAAMGSHFRVGVRRASEQELRDRIADLDVVAVADAQGDVSYDEIYWTRASAIIIGGEAFGPTAVIRTLATANVRIPLARDIESLNAGVAGSLLIFEAARQRRRARYGQSSS